MMTIFILGWTVHHKKCKKYFIQYIERYNGGMKILQSRNDPYTESANYKVFVLFVLRMIK